MMPKGDKYKNGEFSKQKVAVKVTKGQICDGTISKNKENNWYGQFRAFPTNDAIFTLWYSTIEAQLQSRDFFENHK